MAIMKMFEHDSHKTVTQAERQSPSPGTWNVLSAAGVPMPRHETVTRAADTEPVAVADPAAREPGVPDKWSSTKEPLNEEFFLDQVVGAFEEAFDAACNANLAQASNTDGSVWNDETASRDLFCEIAAHYAQPLRTLCFELRRRTASKSSIAFVRPALQMIAQAAETMDLLQAFKRIAEFDEALSLADASSDRLLQSQVQRLLLDKYQLLAEALPQVFRTGEEEQKREEIIVRCLLQQIRGVGRVTLEKLYKAGLGSLEALFLANHQDLSAATSIPATLCRRIVERFQQYRAEVESISADDTQSGYRSRLADLISALQCRQEKLDRSSSKRASAAQLPTLRRQREQCFLQITTTLAELGELDFIQRIQGHSYRQRIQKLQEHLTTLENRI